MKSGIRNIEFFKSDHFYPVRKRKFKVVSYLGNSVLYSTLLAPVPLLYSTLPCTNLILGLGGQQLLELVLGELAEEILLDLHLLPIPLLVVLPQVPGAAPQQLLSMFPGYWYWPPIAAANIYPGIFNQIY